MSSLALIAALLGASLPPPPPQPPPLPPLVLDAATPVVVVTVNGTALRLRVDPATAGRVEINASAAARAGLADPARLIDGQRVVPGRSMTQVGKVNVIETTSDEVMTYAGRLLPLRLAWPRGDTIAGADGLIAPMLLPHDEIRIVRRAAQPTDAVTRLPVRWDDGRGLLGAVRLGRGGSWVRGGGSVDVVITPVAPETLATAAAASILAAGHGGRLIGPAREVIVSHGASRPVRDVVFARPVDIAGFRLGRVAARVFDWSGKTEIPDADPSNGEAVVGGRAGAQRPWAKLAIGADHLDACAEIVWRRVPSTIDLVCPAAR